MTFAPFVALENGADVNRQGCDLARHEYLMATDGLCVGGRTRESTRFDETLANIRVKDSRRRISISGGSDAEYQKPEATLDVVHTLTG